MQITITKGRSEDTIALVRGDGSTAATRFPKKGPVPHDAVHWFVERGLGLKNGFWGLVAAGHHPEAIAEIAKAAGHASAKRAGIPDAIIVEALQAERIVECFEADLWSPGAAFDEAGFLAIAETACGYSHVPLPAIGPGALAAVRNDLHAFAQDWIAAPEGHIARFAWGEEQHDG